MRHLPGAYRRCEFGPMKPGARSLLSDNACAGQSSYRNSRLTRRANQHGFLSQLPPCIDKKSSFRKIRQLTDHQNQQSPVAVSLFYAKEVRNAGSNLDLQAEIPLDKASIGRSRFVLPKTSSQHIGISEKILASSPTGCIEKTEQCPGLNITICLIDHTSIGATPSSFKDAV